MSDGRTTAPTRCECMVLECLGAGDITEGLTMWALGVDRLTARARLELWQEARKAAREIDVLNWRDEAAVYYISRRPRSDS
jgi:hypothetical protein